MLLLISGIGVIVLAVMIFFFSPTRYVRADISGSMAISDTLSINNILTSLLVTSRGIHIPSGQAGALKLFLPLSTSLSSDQLSALAPSGSVFDVSGDVKGITLLPPGRGLFVYAKSMGATFTDEGLENEIKDVMENGLELVDKASVRRDGGHIVVGMQGLVNSGMCDAIRREDASICARTSCPVCSLTACMIAEGLNKKVMVESVKIEGGTISINYEVI
jgi:hypothetical protein